MATADLSCDGERAERKEMGRLVLKWNAYQVSRLMIQEKELSDNLLPPEFCLPSLLTPAWFAMAYEEKPLALEPCFAALILGSKSC